MIRDSTDAATDRGTGYDYGNARLRARASRLLTRQQYAELIASRDLDGMLGGLGATTYGTDVQDALPRYRGIRRLDEALRTNIGRALHEMRSFYNGAAGSRVQLLLERWDWRNLQTVIRAHAGPGSPIDPGTLLIPAGTFGESMLRELASQRNLRAFVEALAAWGLPNRDVARAPLRAWEGYELTGDPALLEHALNRAFATRLVEQIVADDSLTRLLRQEIDAVNLGIALRLRTAAVAEERLSQLEEVTARYLPVGGLRLHVLETVAATTDRSAVFAATVAAVPPRWIPALQEWVEHGDDARALQAIDAARCGTATSLLAGGDPLSIDIPVGYTLAKEAELRNLRLIGRMHVHDLDVEFVERRLVTVVER